MALTLFSRNLGVRRLAVVLAIIASVMTGGLWSLQKFRSLEEEKWTNRYFQSEVAKHPELTLAQNEDGWYLMDNGPHPEWALHRKYGREDWHWRVVEHFPRTVDHKPTLWEYLVPFGAFLGSGVLMSLVVHTVAWVISGFREGRTDRSG